jgi:hypothetical protein
MSIVPMTRSSMIIEPRASFLFMTLNLSYITKLTFGRGISSKKPLQEYLEY